MSETMQVQVGSEFKANGETIEVTDEDGDSVVLHHKDRSVEDEEYKVSRPRSVVEMTAEAEGWEKVDDGVTHPDKFNTIACEVCGEVGHADDAVDRQDQNGIWFACCPDCAGDYETAFVKEQDGAWVVTKANHHAIKEFARKANAKSHAEDVAFNVEER